MTGLDLKMATDGRARPLATISGVAFSVTLVYVQIGIFLGMLDNASVTIDHMDADLWITAHNAANIDFANTFSDAYVQRVRSVAGVDRADNLIVWFVTVALPGGSKESALVYALEDFPRWQFPWDVVRGDPADLRRGRYAILDESAELRFGPFAVGDYREFLGLRMKIVGRSRGARSFTTNPIAFINYRVAQALLPQELHNRTTYILVKLKPGADPLSVRGELQRRLPRNDVWTRAEWAARSRRYWVVSTGLGLSMYVTVFLGALVGVVIVVQTLYTSTIERSAEFAIIKAIGGSNRDVYRIIAAQAVIAALVGFALGVVMTHALQPVLDQLELKTILPPSLAIVIGLVTLGLCLLASSVALRGIATLDPAVIFRR